MALLLPPPALPDERAPAGPPAPAPRPAFVVVGGLPGAGKTVALQRAAAGGVPARVVDSAEVRTALRPQLGRVPYAVWRPLVHALHYARLAVLVLRGPRAVGPLLVHDTATRRPVRVLLAGAARACGWRPVLVVVDVEPAAALTGQRDRRRSVRRRAFARHVARLQRLTRDWDGPTGWRGEGWAAATRTTRTGAPVLLSRVACAERGWQPSLGDC